MKRTLALVVMTLCGCGGSSRLNPLQQTTAATPSTVDDSTDTPADPADDGDADTITTANDPTFGSRCTSTAECGAGLVCSGLQVGATVCTTPCVGSGKGGNDDCPSGYACFNYESTTLDGLQICLADWQLGASTPGYPFTTAAGGACTESANSCQTGVCDSGTNTCVTMCMANRDCASGEVCYAYPADDGDLHICVASDLTTYLSTGQACNANDQCDSGVCANGLCAAHCRDIDDCAAGTVCNFYPVLTTTTGWTPVCVTRDYAGTGALGAGCASDADCASEWCLDSVCTTPCATLDDCNALMPGTDCVQLNLSNTTAIAYSGSFCR